jgi:sterol desaturase/sphingolipid hydroxylase (fatty acid hydroxylase superfamily)
MRTPFDSLLDGDERIFWGYLLASAGIAIALSLCRGESLSAARLKAYFWGADAKLDYCYFPINWLVKSLLLAPLLLSAQTVALWTLDALSAVADPLFLPWRYRHIVLAYTLALFVAGDLSRYWLHRLMHASRWLWLFHKVHHSAEALNPLTFYRVHPLESLLFALRHAVVAGMVTGAFIFCFGARLDIYTVFGSNLFIVCLFAFTGNLRHSHVRLGYGYWLEHLLISPVQHQIHHDSRFMRTNFGSTLAVWDWLFGTLKHACDAPAPERYGLGQGARRHYDSVAKIILRPLAEVRASIRRPADEAIPLTDRSALRR